MKYFNLLLFAIFLLSACVKDLPKNNPYFGTPIITTHNTLYLFADSILSTSQIISFDDEEIIEKGFCLSVDTLPTIKDTTSISLTSLDIQNMFWATIKKFKAGSINHIRSYVKTKNKLVYGNDISVKANGFGNGVRDIEGNLYKTVHIGVQEWMGENLKVTKYNNGKIIPQKPKEISWDEYKNIAWDNVFYNDDIKNKLYGKLYNGYVIKSANNLNICPQGWRIPKIEDWEILSQYLSNFRRNHPFLYEIPYSHSKFDIYDNNVQNVLRAGENDFFGFSVYDYGNSTFHTLEGKVNLDESYLNEFKFNSTTKEEETFIRCIKE